MTEPISPRRPPRTDTERAESKRACLRHLRDLKAAHAAPPADVAVPSTARPRFVPTSAEQSWCVSPAALCAELGE